MLTALSVWQALFYGAVVTGYLLFMMVTLSPRVWGYQDYPERIKERVPPQTRRERITAGVFGVPWMVFTFGYPIYSVLALRSRLGGVITFWDAFLHLLLLAAAATIGDLVFLDWFIVSKVTPGFVVIPGSEVEDYKDFSHHYWAHARAALIMVLLCGAFAFWISS